MPAQDRKMSLVDLQDERDHLTVKLSLLKDAATKDVHAIVRVQKSLVELENSIASQRRADLAD